MIASALDQERIEIESDEVVAAVCLIQLGVAQQPDHKFLSELAEQHDDERHRQVTQILRDINSRDIAEKFLVRFSALIHLTCEWSSHYRMGKKTSVISTRSGIRARWVYRNSSTGRELRRLVGVSQRGTIMALAKAIVDLSPHTFRELKKAAQGINIEFYEPGHLLCSECILRVSSLALSELNTGRPLLREIDRAAFAVKIAYQAVTGKTGSGRGTSPDTSPYAGRPTGELHELLLKIGQIYQVRLVTEASDGRMRRLAKSRVNTTSQ